MLHEGWYLMSPRDVEIELAAIAGRSDDGSSNAVPLTITEAIAYRDEGNVPDALDRSLRLVLFAPAPELGTRRLEYEPDFHEEPLWRVPGSRRITVIPLGAVAGTERARPWWEEPDMAQLEAEWERSGRARGLPVTAEYRSFVYKTIIALEKAGIAVTAESVTASLARWLAPSDLARVREGLEKGIS